MELWYHAYFMMEAHPLRCPYVNSFLSFLTVMQLNQNFISGLP